MQVKQIYQIYDQLEKIENIDYRKIIYKNIKKYRLELYNKYKEEYKRRGTENTYSADNIAAYLGMSNRHYRRLESQNDYHKYVSINNLIKLTYILDKKLEDFLIE